MTCKLCPHNRTAIVLLNDRPACRTCQREVLASKRDVRIAPLPGVTRERIALSVTV